MDGLSSYINILDRVSRSMDAMPRRVATEAVNFSKERFRAQNWVDETTQPWKPRKKLKNESRRRSSRGILINSGRLRRSIRITHVSTDSATIGTDVPYAQAHNDGFRGKVNQKVRAHQRKGRPVRAHSRTMPINIPQRRFIGASAVLESKITRLITSEIIKSLKG